jgi:CBS domain-containing protein
MADSIGTSRRRPGPFGPAWALLPKSQEVLSIPDDTPSWDAIDRMMDSGYSQLPVTKNGRITGVFTWRCFGKRVADLRRSSIKAIDLPVRDCMEPARFIDPDTFIDTATDWSDVDYVLVGSEVKLIGVLCVADVFGRLNDFAEAFVLIYEIEHEVRDLIHAITGEAGLPPLIANMKMPENTRPLRVVTDFTFDQYRGLICAKANWPTFETAFNCIREVIDEDFKQITDLRNIVFHFRRGITPRDTDRLRRFRDSLRYGMELFRQSKLAQTHVEPAPAS